MIAAQKIMQIDQPHAGNHAFPTHMRVTQLQVTQQGKLQLRLRAKAGVSTFSGIRMMSFSIPIQSRLTQPGAGCDDGGIAARIRITLLQSQQVFCAQSGQPIGRRFQIIEQGATLEAEALSQNIGFDIPRKIGGTHCTAQNRPGDAECRMIRRMYIF